jgi:hypothetical protein
MHENVPVRFGRGLDSLGNKGLAAYLIAILPEFRRPLSKFGVPLTSLAVLL